MQENALKTWKQFKVLIMIKINISNRKNKRSNFLNKREFKASPKLRISVKVCFAEKLKYVKIVLNQMGLLSQFNICKIPIKISVIIYLLFIG